MYYLPTQVHTQTVKNTHTHTQRHIYTHTYKDLLRDTIRKHKSNESIVNELTLNTGRFGKIE